ncbi:splicing factor 3B subunit 5 [Strigomonas culicis]|uniref:Splicing factor 3B subunit 5 n=1 Tax=Strigomonas culicis TaxID=28005 RepID=S9W7I7_9TRYP|nr:splicing factor 3B subunit 5 [Strigomonas culicis]|eukprot:EPY31970.1 splicing factor 3B subunit 5 [Strigomonas culicis]
MGDPFVRPGLEYQPLIEEVLLKNEGTITVETTKEEWLRNQHRDTLAAMIQNRDELMYLCLAENVPPAKMERILLERMVDPVKKR